MFKFFVAVLATVRLTQIINYEAIFKPVREYFGIAHSSRMSSFVGTDSKLKNFIGEALSCFACASIWAGLFVALLSGLSNRVSDFFNLVMGLSFLTVLFKQAENKFF